MEAHSSGCSSWRCHSNMASSTFRLRRGKIATATSQAFSRSTGMCAQPTTTCLPSSLIMLRSFGLRERCRCIRSRRQQPVAAKVSRPQTAEPLRKQQQRHRGLGRSLFTRHWCWEWRSSRWRASLFFLLGEHCLDPYTCHSHAMLGLRNACKVKKTLACRVGV